MTLKSPTHHLRNRALRCIGLAAVLALCLGVCCLAQGAAVTVTPTSSSHSNTLLLIDGKAVEVESMKVAPRGTQMMIWIRELEKLGWGEVQPGSPEQVIFKAESVTLTFVKEQSVALVNSLPVQLPIPTYVRDGRLMVPLSFVAKALGYKYECAQHTVAQITTTATKVLPTGDNSVTGKVTYAGKDAVGIVVRIVDADYRLIQAAAATTAEDGSYRIENLPDGEFRAYVYIKDNPSYFNRASDKVVLKDGQTVEVPPITLGRVLTPLKPKIGESVMPAGGRIELSWSECQGAASYKVVVKKAGAAEVVAEVVSEEPKAQIADTKLDTNAVYEVKVTALDEEGEFLGGTEGVGGTPWTFTVTRFTNITDA